jgi:hypothetical protein
LTVKVRGQPGGLSILPVLVRCSSGFGTVAISRPSPRWRPPMGRLAPARRAVALPAFLRPYLVRHRGEQEARRAACTDWTDLDLVCDRGDGRPRHPDTLSSGWYRFVGGRLSPPPPGGVGPGRPSEGDRRAASAQSRAASAGCTSLPGVQRVPPALMTHQSPGTWGYGLQNHSAHGPAARHRQGLRIRAVDESKGRLHAGDHLGSSLAVRASNSFVHDDSHVGSMHFDVDSLPTFP